MARNLLQSVLLTSVVVISAVGGGQAADDVKELKPLRIALVGDSTVASYAKPPADRPTLTGWGQVLGEFFNDKVEVVNHARSGRSSKSFLNEGLWKKTLEVEPDYVFLQFGHNDQPGKGERTTDPDADYQDNLRRYIDEARDAGAKPVLVTPVARRIFADGKVRTDLQPYVGAMKKVGRDRDVPVIDLHAASAALFEQLGDSGSTDFSPSAADRTHFSRVGAQAMAGLVVADLPRAVPELRPYLK
jgi:lysophospholipase L1-like esterase